MIREHWRETDFWPWWWRNRVSANLKLWGAAMVLSLAFAGYVLTQGLQSGASGLEGGASAARVADSVFAKEFDEDLRTATLYRLWKRDNPEESRRYEQFADAVKLDFRAEAPILRTPFGRALVAAAKLAAVRQAQERG